MYSFKWNPSKGQPLPAAPLGWLPCCSWAAWLLLDANAISWRRPQLLGTVLPAVPHARWPSPPCSLPSLKELNAARETYQWMSVNHMSPLAPLRRTRLCFPASKSKRLAGFSPNWRETRKRERKKETTKSSWRGKSHWVGGRRERNPSLYRSLREKRSGALNFWLCALKAAPLWRFLGTEVQIQIALQVWSEAGLKCLEWDAETKMGLSGAYKAGSCEAKDSRASAFHLWEQSSIWTPWLLIMDRIRLEPSACQPANLYVFLPQQVGTSDSKKLGWNSRASGIIPLLYTTSPTRTSLLMT